MNSAVERRACLRASQGGYSARTRIGTVDRKSAPTPPSSAPLLDIRTASCGDDSGSAVLRSPSGSSLACSCRCCPSGRWSDLQVGFPYPKRSSRNCRANGRTRECHAPHSFRNQRFFRLGNVGACSPTPYRPACQSSHGGTVAGGLSGSTRMTSAPCGQRRSRMFRSPARSHSGRANGPDVASLSGRLRPAEWLSIAQTFGQLNRGRSFAYNVLRGLRLTGRCLEGVQ